MFPEQKLISPNKLYLNFGILNATLHSLAESIIESEIHKAKRGKNSAFMF